MPGNSLGLLFRVTTFGESHGPLIGVVIDGVPAGLPLSKDDVWLELKLRRPGQYLTSPRRESDEPDIVSGVFNGRTIGSPVTIIIRNRDVVSQYYEDIRFKPRPLHGDLPAYMKYGVDSWDYRGGGRLSARETAARVAAGAVAKKLLCARGVIVVSYLYSVGDVKLERTPETVDIALRTRLSPVKCPDPDLEQRILSLLREVQESGDSIGGVVETLVFNVPPGLGDPVFDKLKADLAKAILSIPGCLAFELGEGIRMSRMRGSEIDEAIIVRDGVLRWEKNVQGGIIGGLSTGEIIRFRAYFKPTSSIRKPIRTVDLETYRETTITVKGRHDPCIAVRAVPVVEAMTAIILVDHMMRAGYISTDKLTLQELKNIETYWNLYRKYSPKS